MSLVAGEPYPSVPTPDLFVFLLPCKEVLSWGKSLTFPERCKTFYLRDCSPAFDSQRPALLVLSSYGCCCRASALNWCLRTNRNIQRYMYIHATYLHKRYVYTHVHTHTTQPLKYCRKSSGCFQIKKSSSHISLHSQERSLLRPT